jgi:hypothetical protein
MMAVLLIVGLVVGAGVGYFMAPTKTETETETVTVEVEPLAGKTVRLGYIVAETRRRRRLSTWRRCNPLRRWTSA